VKTKPSAARPSEALPIPAIKITCVAAILILALAGQARADAPQSPVDAWMHKHLAAGDVAAAAVADIRAGAIDARGFGQRSPADATAPDADTQFQLGSITKVFTDLLLAELDAAGVARYEQTVGALMMRPTRCRSATYTRLRSQRWDATDLTPFFFTFFHAPGYSIRSGRAMNQTLPASAARHNK
jgi:CubicO group peptidase (beta-lactamase class C family)